MSNVKISNFTTVSGTPANVNNMTAIAGVEFDTGTQANINVKISGAQLITSLESNMVLSNISGTLSIAKGGTGSVTAQSAIDALTGVSSANTNQVLTKDSNGNATFQSLPAGAGVMTTTTLGTAKLFYAAAQAVAPPLNASNDANRTYGIQLNGSNQLVVNVPWEDTEGPVTDVTAGTPGLSTGVPLKVTPTTGNVVITSQAYDGGSNVGHVPDGGSSSNFLRGDGQWVVPTNTVYTAGTGIAISQANVISNNDLGSSQSIYKTITGTSGSTAANSNNDTLNIYSLYYPELKRKLSIYLGILIGVCFGILAQRTKFCFRSALIVGRPNQDTALWMSALVMALAGTQIMIFFGFVSFNEHRFLQNELPWLSIITGGSLFGAGMVLTRGCVSRLTVLVGTGNLRAAMVLLIFGIVGKN